jgi:hypothetical protein
LAIAVTHQPTQSTTTPHQPRSYASTALGYGEGAYKTARGFVPSFAEPYVSSAEDAAAAYAAPLVATANDKAADALTFADAKVDAALASAVSALEYSRSLHAKNMASFSAAKESAYGFVEAYVNATKSALDPQRYVDYATSLGRSIVGAVAAAADPDAVYAYATSTLDKLAAAPPVAKALEVADPLISVGQAQYAKAHDLVVAQPLYKKVYDAAAGLPALVADAPLVKAGYPLVAPVADPVLANFSKSKVLKQLEGHLKPTVVA